MGGGETYHWCGAFKNVLVRFLWYVFPSHEFSNPLCRWGLVQDLWASCSWNGTICPFSVFAHFCREFFVIWPAWRHVSNIGQLCVCVSKKPRSNVNNWTFWTQMCYLPFSGPISDGKNTTFLSLRKGSKSEFANRLPDSLPRRSRTWPSKVWFAGASPDAKTSANDSTRIWQDSSWRCAGSGLPQGPFQKTISTRSKLS